MAAPARRPTGIKSFAWPNKRPAPVSMARPAGPIASDRIASRLSTPSTKSPIANMSTRCAPSCSFRSSRHCGRVRAGRFLAREVFDERRDAMDKR
jgi:hypothetical protein